MAIAKKNILPTEQDPFNPADQIIGPSVHTIVEQYIKPLSMEAGKMSWALMQHPEGLQCDLFVTHAWQEGMFEFIDKVLCSWPWDSRHAWCCMLANPQCLDISELIKTPAESPFAKALCKAKYMLVIPNRKGSIYSRLWCVYEAYLSETSQKIILTARAPILREYQRWIPLVFLCTLGGIVFGFISVELMSTDYLGIAYNISSAAMVICLICWFCSTGYVSSLVFNHISYVLCPICLIIGFRHYGVTAFEQKNIRGAIAASVLSFLATIDVLKRRQHKLEAEELRHNFTGSVRNADCSMASDKEHILSDISNKIDAVDLAVSVLMSVGISTKELRLAAQYGVICPNSATYPLTATLTVYLLWINNIVSDLRFDDSLTLIFGIVGFLLLATWSFKFCMSHVDGRAFQAISTLKLFVYLLLPVSVVRFTASDNFSPQMARLAMLINQSVVALFGILATGIAMVGVGRLASWPCIGPRLAQGLAMRQLCACCHRLRQHTTQATSHISVALKASVSVVNLSLGSTGLGFQSHGHDVPVSIDSSDVEQLGISLPPELKGSTSNDVQCTTLASKFAQPGEDVSVSPRDNPAENVGGTSKILMPFERVVYHDL